MKKQQTLKSYLDNHPEQLEKLFTNIFSRYLIRYYEEAKNFSVFFDRNEETSYMNNREKTIVISLNNIKESLKLDVPLLAVAYHELAHVLFTSFSKRDKIMEAVMNDPLVKRYSTDYYQRKSSIHSIWNIVEDEYIERKMAAKYHYLAPIIAPIGKLIYPDNLLLSWRRKEKAPDELVALAEEYANGASNARSIEIITEIFNKFYRIDPIEIKNKKLEQDEYDDDLVEDDFPEATIEYYEEDDEAIEDEEDDEAIEEDDEAIEDEEDERHTESPKNIDTSNDFDEETSENDEESNEVNVETIEDEEKPKTTDGKNNGEPSNIDEDSQEGEKYANYDIDEVLKKLEETDTDRIIAVDDGDEAIIKILQEMKAMSKEERLKKAYNMSVKIRKEHASKDYYIPEIKFKYNAKIKVMNGMSAAKAKSFSRTISSRISVPKLVESIASRKEPNVFYGKGKDIEFLRKVVVFEDVSGSTYEITGLFSSIAYSLATAFEVSEWWLYADYLAQKHVKDYPLISMGCARVFKKNASLGNSTSAQRLLYVMEKMKDENCIFVIITDGDLGHLFTESYADLFEAYKDKMVVMGLLNKEILNKMKHVVPLDVKKYNHLSREAAFQALVVDSVNEAFEIVRYRVGVSK